MLKKIFSSPSMAYILSKYITYGIQFINSIFIAVYLGPVYLGIWGFILLMTQYLNQINLGIPHSVNTIAAIHKEKEKYISKVIGNAIVILSVLSFLLGCVFLLNYTYEWGFGEKYNFKENSFYILIIGILTHFNSLFSNILRIHGKILEIAFSQSLLPIATLLMLFFYKKEELLMALVCVYVISALVSFIVFIIRIPLAININLDARLWKTILKKGWHLFVYNTSFYFILISTRSFVSHYYGVEEFGYFTFAFSLANVLILLLNSFSFLIWPKLLNRFAKLNNSDSYKLITDVRKLYITTTHALLHIGVCLFPYFLLIFPEYSETFTTFSLIALTIVLFKNSFGYQGLIIARGKEKLIGKLSFFVLILNISLCYILIKWGEVDYEYLILATLVTYLIYIIFLNIFGRLTLDLNLKSVDVLKDTFPLSLLIPFATSLLMVLLKLDFYYYMIPLFIFLGLNLKTLEEIKSTIKKLIVNPRFFEI